MRFSRAAAIATERTQRSQRIAELSLTRRGAAAALEALQLLPSALDRPTMVPLGSEALALGRLASDGRVLAYLGEGYFAWRSSAEACGVAERRLMYIDARIAEHQYAIAHLDHLALSDRIAAAAGQSVPPSEPSAASGPANAPTTTTTTTAGAGPAEVRRDVLDDGTVLRHLDDGTVDIREPPRVVDVEATAVHSSSSSSSSATREPSSAGDVLAWLETRRKTEETGGELAAAAAEEEAPSAATTRDRTTPSGEPDFDKIMAQLALLEEQEEQEEEEEEDEEEVAAVPVRVPPSVPSPAPSAPVSIAPPPAARAAPEGGGLLARVRAAKERGNEAYRGALAKSAGSKDRDRDLTYATALYTDALALLCPSSVEPLRSEQPVHHSLAIDIHMNLAAVAVKRRRWTNALEHSTTVLVTLGSPQNAKALYRKAVALRGLGRTEDAIAAAAEAKCLTSGRSAAIDALEKKLAAELRSKRSHWIGGTPPAAKAMEHTSFPSSPASYSSSSSSDSTSPPAPPSAPAFTGRVMERTPRPLAGARKGGDAAPPKKRVSRFMQKRRGELDDEDV